MTIFVFFFLLFHLCTHQVEEELELELGAVDGSSDLKIVTRCSPYVDEFQLPTPNMFLINTLDNEHFEQHQNLNKTEFLLRNLKSLIFGGLGEFSIFRSRIRIFVRVIRLIRNPEYLAEI